SSEARPVDYLVNFLRRPLRLQIESLETPGAAAEQLIRASLGANNELKFSDLPPGRVWLRGRGAWDRGLGALLTELNIARVYVHGFQQLRALLDPPQGPNPRERSFRVPILLSKSKDNVVEVELPGLPIATESRSKFALDCRQPVAGKRLHLLAI